MTTKTMDSESYLANVESADIANSKFVPTKEELEELGFEGNELGYARYATPITFITYTQNTWLIGIREPTIIFRNIYPQSLDDIRTLIRLLTPQ